MPSSTKMEAQLKNKTTDFNKFPAPTVRFNARKSTRNRVVAPLISASTSPKFRFGSTTGKSPAPTANNKEATTTTPTSTLTTQTISIVPADKCPFRTLIEEWLDYGRADDLALKTIADYHDKVYKFWWWWHDHTQYAHKLGAHPPNVTVKEAREYVVYLREPQEMRWGIEAKVKKPKLSAASVSSYGRAVKVFFNWLEAENYIETNPFGKKVKFSNRHKQDQTIKRVQESDLTLLFTFLTAPTRVATYLGCRDLAIICFLLDSGIRLESYFP